MDLPARTVEEVLSLMKDAEWVNFACPESKTQQVPLIVDSVSPINAA